MAVHYVLSDADYDSAKMWAKIEGIFPAEISVWLSASSENFDTKVYCIKDRPGVGIVTLSKNGAMPLGPINYSGATVITKNDKIITDAYKLPFDIKGCGQIYLNQFELNVFKELDEKFKQLVKGA